MLVSIADIVKEMRLLQDVNSKLGGVLYRKGSLLRDIDREILEAYGVEKVEVEEIGYNKIKENKINNQEKELDDQFYVLFKKAIKIIDNIFKSTQGNIQIPIIELRKALNPLLQDQYQQAIYLLNLNYKNSDFGNYDSHHALSVGLIAHAIAKWSGLEQGERTQIALAGVLHDIGMSRIPSNIINTKESLSSSDYEEIRKHTVYGYQILKETKGLSEGAILTILQHHEREDGSGYPLHLKKENIHQYAKIVAIADIFHAMNSKRSFREEYSPFQSMEQISMDGFGKLDPLIVRVFINNITKLTVGTDVILSNNKNGVIVYVDQQNPTKPWIKIGDDIINLNYEKNLYVKKIL